MKKKLLISLLATIGLLVVAVTIAYLIVLVRKPALNMANNLEKTTKKPATTTSIVNSFNAGSYDESLKLANDYLQKHPKDAQAWAAKATILANKGSVEFKENTYGQQAIEAANKALTINPQLPEGFYARGYANEIQNQFEQAKSDYDKALSMDKDNPTYLNQMGHLYDLMGKPEEAKKYYEQALAINPNFGKALINMARYELRYGDKTKAREYFEKSLPVIDNNMDKAGVYYSLGMLDLNQDKLQEGYKYMQQAVKMAPKYPQALIGRGWAGMLLMTADGANLEELMKEGLTFETVFGDVNKAVEINPNQTVGYLTLARMHLKLPFLADKSLEYYDQALAVVDKDVTVMGNDREDFKKGINLEKKRAENIIRDVKQFQKTDNNKKSGYLHNRQNELSVIIDNFKRELVGKEAWAGNGVFMQNCYVEGGVINVCYSTDDFSGWIQHVRDKYPEDESAAVRIDDYYYTCSNGAQMYLMVCGSSNGASNIQTKPTKNLCTFGKVIWVDEIANDGTWNWQCYDKHGNKSINCSANKNYSCTGLLSAGMKPCPGTTTGLTKDTGWELIDNCENAGDAKCKYEFQCSDGDPTKQPPFKATWCPGDDHGLTSRTNWHEVSACTTTDKCEYYFKPECGPANKHSFSTETQVEQAGLCETNNTASSIDSSGLEVGDPWTWTCSRSGQTIDCKAYQIGQCNSNHNSLSLNSACTAGKINSIYFDSTTPKLTWACGTLTNGQPANPPLTLLRDGTAIPGYNFTNLTVTDSTEKHSSGADCSCTPQYQYSCVSQGYDCNNKCGQNVTEVYQAYKKDSHCFPGNSQPIPIAQQEYNNHNSTTCTNKPVTCPPCGVGGGGSDTINETN